MSDTTMGSRTGAMFGHYRLLRLLGPGGFGEVYEAEDTSLHRLVALKLIAAPYSHDPVFRERLFREAQHAARLHDPHVVPIHGCGEIDGQLYIDMRLIKGITLHTLLAHEGPLDPPRAVAIVRQIASALDAAHDNQVVHRDVKPANILITRDDFACLVDFGLANAAGEAKLTSVGAAIGTFAYMAPERFSNADVTFRSDIYALACVLYQCLTGSTPYPADDMPALVAAHLSAPIPRPSEHRRDLPAGLDDVIMRGMAKDPAQRYASAGDLALAAGHALTGPDQDRLETVLVHTRAATSPGRSSPVDEPTWDPAMMATPTRSVHAETMPDRQQAKPSRARRMGRAIRLSSGRRRLAIAAGAVALVAAVVVGAVVMVGHRRSPAPPPPPPPPVAKPAQAVLADGVSDPRGVAVDSNGTVYVAESGNDKVVALVPGSTPTALRFTGARDTLGMAVDSKGTPYVTDTVNNQVLALPAGSTVPTVLPFAGLDYPSGVAVDTNDTVYVTDTGNHRVLALRAGSATQRALPLTGMPDTSGVAVDGQGTVYVTDTRNNQVLALPAGATTPTVLPFAGLRYPTGVAVDSKGTVYVTDSNNHQVLALSAGSTTPTVLPFTGLKSPWGVAVDGKGTVYVTDSQNNRVVTLPAP
ncbi:serine/threonine-protein kinase PknD [Mycobacterium bohemicum]|uniref:non-specific serine/threonine protein kinase n=1 Tax=Mycobacterium bohemicum TaxID=56425 RepID=A0A1X1QZL7_MYCBE|nr:serine/threonine-protein kinase PknD [Mycobacterium bohemicum]MCV6968099.1 protein kinase [Mycobacterium bohemicum]ORU96895.1 hypothetical protein AWB93_19500 [Mycobacterium bohemicum]